jgi:hypothetical protein
MFKQSVTATILFICLTTVTPGIANAQGHDRIEGKLKPCRFASPTPSFSHVGIGSSAL